MTSSAPDKDAIITGAADHTRLLAYTSLLAALAMVLSFVETMIPLPVTLPGVKLGLSNVAVLIALYAVGTRCAARVLVVKVLAAGFIFGSPVMIAYSAGGSLLAFCAMLVCKRIPLLSICVTSMVAALAHNAGQLVVAACMLGSASVMINMVPLALAGCITGLATGALAQSVYALVNVTNVPPQTLPSEHDLERLALSPGALIAFVGVNGSGKSSFARGLCACEGAGRAVMACQDADSQIVAQTVRDDVAYGLEMRGVERSEMERRVTRELERVGLAGYENSPIETLSGGQKQLVVLAGLAILDPEVIIFDETSSMMDFAARETFARVVDELLADGVCVVLITQDMDEALRADRIALFAGGKIHDVLTAEELRFNGQALEDVGLAVPALSAGSKARCAPVPVERGDEMRLMPQKGSIVGLCGNNGVGKSSALGVLSRELGDKASFLRQRPESQLFAMTAFDDVAFGLRSEGCDADEVEQRVEHALASVGLDAKISRQKSPFEYSGGERRRVALAGILALERPYVLLDEPTVGLDPANARIVWDLVARLRDEGFAVVVVSHDVKTLEVLSDNLYELCWDPQEDDVSEASADKGKAADESRRIRQFGVYRQKRSFAHGLDPRAKTIFVLLLLIACAFADDMTSMGILVLASAATLVASAAKPRDVLATLKGFVPLMVFVVVFDLFFVSGEDVLVSFAMLQITSKGLCFALTSLVRFACALISSSQLMACTRPTELADALAQLVSPLRRVGAHVDDLTFSVQATFRFVPVLTEEFSRIRACLIDRGIKLDAGSFRARMRLFMPVIVPLFASVFSRADTLAVAIRNRSSFEQCVPTCIRGYHMRCADWLLVAVGILIVCVCL